MTVYNQGSVSASNIEITDYIPCGYEYLTSNDANGWMYDAAENKATIHYIRTNSTRCKYDTKLDNADPRLL